MLNMPFETQTHASRLSSRCVYVDCVVVSSKFDRERLGRCHLVWPSSSLAQAASILPSCCYFLVLSDTNTSGRQIRCKQPSSLLPPVTPKDASHEKFYITTAINYTNGAYKQFCDCIYTLSLFMHVYVYVCIHACKHTDLSNHDTRTKDCTGLHERADILECT